MDPQATLSEILNAIEDGERETAIENMENLLEWMKKGGAMPIVEWHGRDYQNGCPSGYHIP